MLRIEIGRGNRSPATRRDGLVGRARADAFALGRGRVGASGPVAHRRDRSASGAVATLVAGRSGRGRVAAG
ncbi:MAG: hypothetical protein AAF805_15500, partial [Planctomycetota bacterium]